MGEKSKLLDGETNFTERYDGADFIAKQDVQLSKGRKMEDGALQVQNNYHASNMFRSKSDSALSRKNSGKLVKDKIILLNSFGADKFIHVPDTKLQTCQLSSSESCLSYDDKITNDVHTYKNMTPCIDEKETLFNQSSKMKIPLSSLQCSINKEMIKTCQNNLPEDKHDNINFKEQIGENSLPKVEQSYQEIMNSQLQINDKTLIEKKQDEEDLSKKHGTNSTLTLNTQMRNNLISRPSLADDSKLVKMSFLANPINIMQSNVQLLNKSRNFLNFITEKSTNIMEKALLPQHLAMKYNHISKSIEADAMRFYTNKESSSRDVISSSDLTNPNNILNVTSCTAKQRHDSGENKSDSVVNSENEISPSVHLKDGKMCEDFKKCEEQLLHSNIFENEIEKTDEKYIFQKNDVDRLNYDIINEEENKTQSDFLRTEKLHNDTCKEDSSDTLIDSNILKSNSLEHPLYLALLEDYTNLKFKNSNLLEKIEYLENSSQSGKLFQETQTNTDAFALQVKNLEKTISKLTADLNASLDTQEALKQECSTVNKEKENMVMKYVISEKQLIDMQRSRDCAERKVKEVLKDQELLQNKLRQSQGERTRICNILDGKCREIVDLQKETERLKEDIKLKEIKLKWSETKIKSEKELQKDTQQELNKANMEKNNMKEECEHIRRETQESIRKFQQSEENRAVTLDQQLKEHQARLILERHVTKDKETLRLQLQKELETLKSKQQNLTEENKKLNLMVQEFEKARLNNESNLSNLQTIANQRQEQITELLNKVSQLETLQLQLQHKEEHITSVETQILQLRSANEELRSDMQACRQKEADMLDFTQKLTDKNVRLQSEFTAIQTKANHLESQYGPLRECINELTSKVKSLEENLTQERKKRREECEILAKHVAEQTQLAQNLSQKLEDSQGENAVLKRKHQISIKEMTRELQQCRRKLEMYEAASPSNSLDITSRTGSNTSLNAGDTLNGALSDNNANDDHIHSLEPSKQVLMDRIIKLQKINVKRAEKLDFLDEHTQTLVEELQKKTKIIQNYILNQNFGALTCNERDRHKHIKSRRDTAELARHGGIMASVYNHRVSDENMTLELSLEINQKLQAVLEDALLKNITLKDNIDTLGNEIAKLTMQHQQKQIEN
ncbi:coiled-coil domain-containing protein 186 isoform X1 [Linepithema humile]|uniref:coiled-coil domain-containing protein 186 isoform X1 n=1 Tax=Linepithema humile TaxID=83485 RepID=UPI00351E43C5